MKTMKEAGCEEILVGVESASERILNTIYNKKLDSASIRDIFRIGKDLNIVITPSFILGYIDETPEELEATKQLIIELYRDNYRHPRMCYLTPFPGTNISNEAFNGKLHDYLEEKDWDRYTHICPTLRTKYMSRHELARFYVDILAEITAQNKERVKRIWPEEETSIDQYYKPKISMYRMKEAIINKNTNRLNDLIQMG
jgi:magnesium-protoporphyrin IX monomethyl ester (oxidative) cyclase